MQDTQKAKQFLPFLQRAGRSEAVVEYVFSGSRLKLFLPKETCLITFLLAGELPAARQGPAEPCNSLQCRAEPCNSMQKCAELCNSMQSCAELCNSM